MLLEQASCGETIRDREILGRLPSAMKLLGRTSF